MGIVISMMDCDTRLDVSEIENWKTIQGYVDVDYAGDLDQRRSTKGYVFTVVECTVSWKTELQDTMTHSAEYIAASVEYIAVVETSKKALWLRGLVEIFGII